MATTEFSARSVYGLTCEQCGFGVIAPALSEYVTPQHIRHLWRCPNCGCQSETSAYFRANADSKMHDDKMKDAFLSLLE